MLQRHWLTDMDMAELDPAELGEEILNSFALCYPLPRFLLPFRLFLGELQNFFGFFR